MLVNELYNNLLDLEVYFKAKKDIAEFEGSQNDINYINNARTAYRTLDNIVSFLMEPAVRYAESDIMDLKLVKEEKGET